MALTARGVCFAMALVVVACGDDGPATVHDVVNDVDTASDTTPDFLALPGPQPRFGPRVSFYDAPVPAPDLLASGHPDLTLFPREMGGFVDGLVALTETTDGASLAGSVFFALTAPLPEGALAKLEATFIDLDDQTTRPARLGFELDGGPHGAPNLLSAQPIQGLALLPGRRYALAVYMAPELRSTLGRPALFADLLAGRETPGFDAEPWKPALAAARASNPDESSLFALTTFTTQRTTDGLMTFLEAARTHGVSKYGLSRFAKGFLDLITIWFLGRYRWRPQHVIGMTGVIISVAMLLGAVVSPVSAMLLQACWGLGFILMPATALIAIGLVAQFMLERRPLDGLYDVAERVGWCREVSDTRTDPRPNGGDNP